MFRILSWVYNTIWRTTAWYEISIPPGAKNEYPKCSPSRRNILISTTCHWILTKFLCVMWVIIFSTQLITDRLSTGLSKGHLNVGHIWWPVEHIWWPVLEIPWHCSWNNYTKNIKINSKRSQYDTNINENKTRQTNNQTNKQTNKRTKAGTMYHCFY